MTKHAQNIEETELNEVTLLSASPGSSVFQEIEVQPVSSDDVINVTQHQQPVLQLQARALKLDVAGKQKPAVTKSRTQK